VPLPFAQAEYDEKDFPNSIDEFRQLLHSARRGGAGASQVVELDGTRGRQDESYFEAGRFVLRHSDLLLAIWDGDPETGVGGTGQVIRMARTYGVPVVWIDSAVPHERRILVERWSLRGKS
jgi:hypothetical protein